jgi:hypothetical protein
MECRIADELLNTSDRISQPKFHLVHVSIMTRAGILALDRVTIGTYEFAFPLRTNGKLIDYFQE